MSCPACERNRLAGKRFCTECGAKLVDDAPVQQAAPAEEVVQQAASPAEEVVQQAAAPAEEVVQQAASPAEEVVQQAPVQQGNWKEVPAQETPVQQDTWQAAPAPEPAPAPTYVPPVVEVEKPKKKSNKALIAIIGVIAALAVAAGVLFGTGVISFGGSSDKEDTEESDEPADDDQEDKEEDKQEEETKADDGSFELVSNSDCAVTVRGFEEDGDDYVVLLALENKTDELARFNVVLRGVNGYSLNDMPYSAWGDVEPGDTLNTRLTFPKEEYAAYQLGDVDLLTLNVDVHNSAYDSYFDDAVSFRLNGKDVKDFQAPERMTFEKEQTLLDQDGVLITIGNPTIDEWGDLVVMIYYQNTTDSDLMVDMDEAKANDFVLEYGGTMISIPANCVGYDTYTVDDYDLEESGFTAADVTKLEFLMEAEFWDEFEPMFSETVTYVFG